jgi:hypothetical protein
VIFGLPAQGTSLFHVENLLEADHFKQPPRAEVDLAEGPTARANSFEKNADRLRNR